ncbi:amino acid permease [Tichowtungia aerotolerans]|uniref:Amino acid permease n=1 Tax=Tichowtungia aerotolerans TaxID=2697043 RepID=A0A6P1M9W3_9BACT|nr:amino acid permease [Tichowtungia aerotolerans]QHI68878.1 amino acid permease [Tichowtungia aerotolerans]
MPLKRHLGLAHVFCIATGAMVSSGIFVLPGIAHAKAGPAVILSYLIAGLVACIGMLSAAELVTAMPKAGGDYFFVTRGLGPGVGTIAGLLTWFSLSLKSAFAIVGMSALITAFLPVNRHLAGLLCCLLFTVLNLFGSKHAARTQLLLVAGLLALMLYYIIRGAPHVAVENLVPFVPHGAESVLFTAAFVFVAYGGIIQISSIAEDVAKPGKTIPQGMILALVTTTLFYTLMVWVTSGVLAADKLDHSLTPIADGAAVFMGPTGRFLVGTAALLAFMSTANAGILAASRYLLALGRDELAPSFLSRLHRRFKTPHIAILITSAFIAVALFLKLDILVEAASLVLILGFILSGICVIVLRESHLQNYRPAFRAPLYPFLQIIGILSGLLLVFEMGVMAFVIFSLLAVTGFTIYRCYGRHRARRESALSHLTARLTARELLTGDLEEELKQVLRERDEIELDRLDHLITESIILDLEQAASSEELFQLVSEVAAERAGLPSEELDHKLIEREQMASTVLSPDIAVPHLVLPGDHRFEIIPIRIREGVAFSEEAPAVKAVFVLMGTLDERTFHLRALAGIAQIVQEPDFIERWTAARNESALRDLLLLASRHRQ